MIYDYFRDTGVNESVLNYADIFTVALRTTTFRSSIQDGTKISLSITNSHLMISWSLCALGIRESDPLKTLLELYNVEIHILKYLYESIL